MSKKVSLGVAATVTLIAMAVTFSMTMTVSMNMFNNTVSSVKNKERMYNKLSEVDRYVRANEYFDINDDTLNDTIASGYMLGISDRYARYYSAKAYSERVGLANGRLMGIGVAVVKDPSSGYARIIRVYDNTPATNVGLEVGGFITAIGDTSTRSMSDAAAMTSALLGEEGSIVSIKYLTPLREEQSFEIIHANYTTPSISTVRLMDNGVGYLRIDSFTSGTAVEFRNAVNSLTNQGATSLIFDLRDNSGENLNAALVATDYCVPSGLIAQSQDKDGNVTDLRMSDENEITLPMVCLVNDSTASGAELFANALRKMAGATIVGSTTAGKGVLLSDPQSLSDGSAVVITVGILLDNEGKNWNGTGLTPDVDASLTNDEQSSYYDFTVDNDPQITKAINAISGANGQ
ncbi:MAG: S41 family peptidase [Gemmiger qucibialis]|nr:S41 family peptidase [Subdoligranulum sp.]MDY4233010.1 S41 family peptidase [Gemmiger qucibialis]MCI6221143.1 S41 family peptidase [Subdoligranulum sp.]MCI6444858.1 S41 family peptidase [Subdoligranulum sp.]MCI6623651.1 S41 family peptidase [Subdoligranulum sp.]